MKKYYLIDSENVGDSWISLLLSAAPEDEILVFYTLKSPHMSYRNLILLKQSPREVCFIECCEGANALDFQLCTELGYRIHEAPACEYVIVTNDTGYDAVVKYWKQRSIAVRRLPGKLCSAVKPALPASEELRPAETALPVEADVPEIAPAALLNAEDASPSLPEAPSAPASAAPAVHPAEGQVTDACALEILYCVGKDNLADLHEALTQLYGSKKALSVYNSFKSESSYNTYLAKHEKLSSEEKQSSYCKVVFALADPPAEMPADFPSAVMNCWRQKKNLNSLRATLQNRYGREKCSVYYSMIKAHIKVLDNIK